jgi:hypothetical protein
LSCGYVIRLTDAKMELIPEDVRSGVTLTNSASRPAEAVAAITH